MGVCVIGFMMIIVNATDEDSTSKDEAALINVRRSWRNVVVMQLLYPT